MMTTTFRWLLSTLAIISCRPEPQSEPCSVIKHSHFENDVIIRCDLSQYKNENAGEELKSVLDQLEFTNGSRTLHLDGGSIFYPVNLAEDTFKTVNCFHLKLIRFEVDMLKEYSDDLRLTTTSVFGKNLKSLSLEKIDTIYGWEWESLKMSPSIHTLSIIKCRLLHLKKSLLENAKNLRNLIIDSSQISFMDLKCLMGPVLEYLVLRDNKLDKFLPDHFVEKLKSLWFLDLSGNNIEDLDPDLFTRYLPELEELHLERNKLRTLDARGSSKLNELWIDRNPLDCDESKICWLNEKNPKIHFWTNATCEDGQELKSLIDYCAGKVCEPESCLNYLF